MPIERVITSVEDIVSKQLNYWFKNSSVDLGIPAGQLECFHNSQYLIVTIGSNTHRYDYVNNPKYMQFKGQTNTDYTNKIVAAILDDIDNFYSLEKKLQALGL